MRTLVVNSGSSSIKFSIFEGDARSGSQDPACVLDGELAGVGSADAKLTVKTPEASSKPVLAATTEQAIQAVFDTVSAPGQPAFNAVGYRVVHSGPKLDRHQRITPEVLEDLRQASGFAPLHEPEAVLIIQEGLRRFSDLPHYACFDTVFHRTMPEEASAYPLPDAYRQAGVRRYGFHGLSCESVLRQIRASNEKLPRRMVIAHLGSGCSVTAIVDGCSVDTSMGFTPTGGVVMGTRPGDLDPGLVLYLLRQQQGDKAVAAEAVEGMLNHASGMVALSGLPNDFKAVRKAANDGDPSADLAIRVFTRSVTKAMGSYCWLMGGLDAVIFSGGIGEHDSLTRKEILASLGAMGISLDDSLNDSHETAVRRISGPGSAVAVMVVPAQEDLMIAVHVGRLQNTDN